MQEKKEMTNQEAQEKLDNQYLTVDEWVEAMGLEKKNKIEKEINGKFGNLLLRK